MKVRRTYAVLLALILLLNAALDASGAWMGAALAEEESADEQVLVFKTPDFQKGYGDYKLAAEFNRTHPGKRIVVEEIPDDQLLATEIMSGKADYMINGCYLDPFKYSTSGQFYDIAEWMDADPDFHREDYYESLFTAMEYDGHLYAMPAVFTFGEVVYLNGTIAEALGVSYELLDTITPSEILDLYENAKAQGLMAEDSPLVFQDPAAPGTLFKTTEYPSHVDFSARTTNFSTPEFIEFLERTKQIDTERRIADGWQSLADSFSKALARQKTDSLVKFDDIGIWRDPGAEGGLEAMPDGLMGPLLIQADNGGMMAYPVQAYMVPKSCSNPELAWEFLKFCIAPLDEENGETPSNLDKTQQGFGFPLSKKNMRLYTKMYNSFGTADYEASLAKLEERIGDISIFHYYVRDLLGSLTPILEQYYDYGTITAEECAKQMDERAYLYLNE